MTCKHGGPSPQARKCQNAFPNSRERQHHGHRSKHPRTTPTFGHFIINTNFWDQDYATNLATMAPSKANNAEYSKDEKVLCFHLELLYEAKVLDVKPKDPNDKGDGYVYKIHYKGWKNT